MTELSEISSQLKVMRDSIAAFTEAANARLNWEKFVERDASGLENAINQMARAVTELSIAIDQMTETVEENRASNALDTQKVLIEVEKLTNSLSDNFFFRLGGKKKDS
jgi:uncharacterized protein YoxC